MSMKMSRLAQAPFPSIPLWSMYTKKTLRFFVLEKVQAFFIFKNYPVNVQE